jgi:hypothetical protein
MLPLKTVVDIREYQGRGSHSAFRAWYEVLNAEAARKVTTALYRLGLGISPMPKVLVPVFTNARSILAQGIECILGKMAS